MYWWVFLLLSAPVISITDTDGDVAENGRELPSDSKVCAAFFMNSPLWLYSKWMIKNDKNNHSVV